MYKPIYPKNVSFERIKVTSESATRLAVSTFCTECHWYVSYDVSVRYSAINLMFDNTSLAYCDHLILHE